MMPMLVKTNCEQSSLVLPEFSPALILLTAAMANAQTTAQPVATEPVIHEHAHEHTMAANHTPPFQSPACELPLSDHTRGHDALAGDTDGHAHSHMHIPVTLGQCVSTLFATVNPVRFRCTEPQGGLDPRIRLATWCQTECVNGVCSERCSPSEPYMKWVGSDTHGWQMTGTRPADWEDCR